MLRNVLRFAGLWNVPARHRREFFRFGKKRIDLIIR
jgi:hypothetical protein